MPESFQPDRREFLLASAGAIGAMRAFPAGMSQPDPGLLVAPPMPTVRLGIVGVGHQGSSHVDSFLKLEGVEIRAICDLVPERVTKEQDKAVAAGKPRPAGYSGTPDAFRRMCDTEELDLVFTATPWEWHAPVCLYAMRHGKHAATEVPMAVTQDELWEMVETSEKTKRHCVMMENCCYDRTEMMILNMVRKGLFGELLHAECGYLHDLRELKLTDYYQGRWRIAHSIRRNGDLYPTHGVGPVAQWMNVNRGNQFDYLTSMASNGRGLNKWAAEHIGPDSPEARQAYRLGDVVSSLIRTTAGETILVVHDTNSPRPYSRKIFLQGVQGVVEKYPKEQIHIEGRSKPHRWDELSAYQEEFDHPIWRELEARSKGAGHGGMDFIEVYRLVECLRRGEPMDMDVYDGASWSVISALSEQSIKSRSRAVDVPDFTRGAWKTRQPLGIVTG